MSAISNNEPRSLPRTPPTRSAGAAGVQLTGGATGNVSRNGDQTTAEAALRGGVQRQVGPATAAAACDVRGRVQLDGFTPTGGQLAGGCDAQLGVGGRLSAGGASVGGNAGARARVEADTDGNVRGTVGAGARGEFTVPATPFTPRLTCSAGVEATAGVRRDAQTGRWSPTAGLSYTAPSCRRAP